MCTKVCSVLTISCAVGTGLLPFFTIYARLYGADVACYFGLVEFAKACKV